MRTGRRWTTLTKLPVAFCGGSNARVEPEVHINEPATGPDAGKYLQTNTSPRPAAGSTAATGTGK